MSHDATAGDSSPTGTDTTMETRYLTEHLRVVGGAEFRVLQNGISLSARQFAILTQQETIARALTNRRVGRMVGASGTTVVGLTMGLAGAVMMAFALSSDFGMNGLLPLVVCFLRAEGSPFTVLLNSSSGACRCTVFGRSKRRTPTQNATIAVSYFPISFHEHPKFG